MRMIFHGNELSHFITITLIFFIHCMQTLNDFIIFVWTEVFAHDKIHYRDVIMKTIAFQISSVSIVYLTVSTGADQRKHQSSASLAFVRVIYRGPVNSPHKGPVTRKMFPFDDVIMHSLNYHHLSLPMARSLFKSPPSIVVIVWSCKIIDVIPGLSFIHTRGNLKLWSA